MQPRAFPTIFTSCYHHRWVFTFSEATTNVEGSQTGSDYVRNATRACRASRLLCSFAHDDEAHPSRYTTCQRLGVRIGLTAQRNRVSLLLHWTNECLRFCGDDRLGKAAVTSVTLRHRRYRIIVSVLKIRRQHFKSFLIVFSIHLDGPPLHRNKK